MCAEDVDMIKDLHGRVTTVDAKGFTAVFNASELMRSTALAPVVSDVQALWVFKPPVHKLRCLDMASDAALASLFDGNFIDVSQLPRKAGHGE
jgi:hypothetical protein